MTMGDGVLVSEELLDDCPVRSGVRPYHDQLTDYLRCGSFWATGSKGNQYVLLELLKIIHFIVILKAHHCICQIDRIFL